MRYYSSTAVRTTIANVAGLTTGTTTLSIAVQTGYPTQFPFTIRLDAGTASEELVSVTGGAGTIGTPYTITRGFDGTTASSHATGAAVSHAVAAIDVREAQTFMQNAYIDVITQYAAAGDGVTNDATKIQNALNAALPGQIVYLPGGKNYALSTPLSIPPGVTLRGTLPRGRAVFSEPTEEKSALVGLSGFAGSALILIKSQAEGSYSIASRNAGVESLVLSGSALPPSVSGIKITGAVHSVTISDVLIQGCTDRGLWITSFSGNHADTIALRNVTCVQNGAEGFLLDACTDLEVSHCMATSNDTVGTDGWHINGTENSHFTSCRAEHMPGNGFYITGDWLSNEGSGGANFVDLSTDRNTKNGILVDANGGTGAFGFIGCYLGRDGRNSNTGGGSYAAFKASHGTAVTNPIHISGITVFPGVDDNATGVNSPQIGISADHCASFSVEGGYVHAATTAISDGGNNTVFAVGQIGTATGTTALPVRSWYSYKDRSVVGNWYFITDGPDTTLAMTQSRMVLAQFAARAALIDQIAVEVTTLAAGSSVRLGIYNDDGFGRPGTLLADFATVVTTSTGVKVIDVNQSVIPGRDYWVAVVAQGGAPELTASTHAGSPSKLVSLGTATPTSLFTANGYYQSAVTGSLPSSFTFTPGQTVPVFPKVVVKW